MASKVFFSFALALLFCLSASAQVVTQFNKTVAPDPLTSSWFGFSMTSFGSILAVGAYFWDFNTTLADTGAAYLYNCTSFPCTFLSKAVASDAGVGDAMGYSVALTETIFVSGAKLANFAGAADAGAVYVYSYNSTSVAQILKLNASTPVANENFGNSVAISGSLLAVGAPTSISSRVGSVYVYTWSDNTYTLVTKLTNTSTTNPIPINLGRSVAIEGNFLVAGADGTKVGSNTNQGAVYLFDCNATACTPGAILKASDGKTSDQFGSSVAIKDQLVVVGTQSSGAAYVFRCTSPYSCTQIAKFSTPDGVSSDQFGFSVATNDFLVVVGGRQHKVGGISQAGSAYIYDCFEYTCRYITALSASDPASQDYLGHSVTLMGWKVAAGAQGYSSSLGYVKFFDPSVAICNCSNSLGSTCGSDRQCACIQGWTGHQCTTDVNECLLETDDCHAQATCNNTAGSFTCTCNKGWVGNGTFCEDEDECIQGTNNCAPYSFCTNTIGSYTCACDSVHYGDGFTCTACGCGTASNGTCDSNGVCLCYPGGNGTKCDFCEAGRYGSTCTQCPNCLHGTCAEGISNNGSCLCDDRYALNGAGVCGACMDQHYGSLCIPCPECNNGMCYSGISGNGTCICNPGWKHTNETSFCSSCAPGYAMDGNGACKLCDPTCKTCFGVGASQCLTCSGSLIFNPDLNTCVSNCPSGEYDNAGQCTSCHTSCSECSGGGAGQCTSCPAGKVYDFGFCRSACQTPATFNSSGTCIDCPLTCSACLNDQPGGCTACKTTSPQLVLDAGNCSKPTCSKLNSYISNGICYDCDPNCKTCSGPSDAECTSCTAPTSLSNGACVNVCPSKQFSNNQVCQDCHDTCGSCSGPSVLECTGCDPSSSSPYKYGSSCLNRCPSFTFAPNGTFECTSCFCSNFSTNCDSSGVCLACQGNTQGTNCDRCISGFGRQTPFNSTEACTDLDECTLQTDNCAQNASCTNAIGTFTCSCLSGFNGTGTFCQDINECALNTITCQANSTCVNSVGSYQCQCDPGFRSINGTECVLDTSDKSRQTKVALGAALGSVLGLAAVLSAFLLITYKLEKGPFARKKHTLHDVIVEMDYGSSAALAANTEAGGTNNMTTMLNTVNEIALPGFLMINTEKQLRMELDIAAGGGGKISIASILDPKLKEENGGKEKVVVKLVTGVASLDEEDNLLLFQQEVAAMSALRNHRFVATLLGFCNNPPTIVVPLYAGDLYGYIHGTDSFKNLPQGHKITFPFQAILAYEIIDAFSVIHTIGIVHRDLKTKNLLLEATPEARFPYKIRVSDFGICRIVQEQGIKTQNFLNIFGVSTRYAAPEVFSRGFLPNATLDAEDEKKTDVYSFAICLWEMFTKKIPWGELTGEEIQKRVGNAERPELPQIMEQAGDKEIQMALVDMIGLCWNQNPHRRPTFKSLVDKIHSIKGVV